MDTQIPTPTPTPIPTPTPVPPVVTPPTPPVAPSGHSGEVRLVLPALLLVLILAGGYYWYASRSSAPAVAPTATTTVATSSVATDVKVEKTDLSAGASKLPAGFPDAIPVEQATITESYKAVYTDHGLTQYTVSYTSTQSKDALWKVYTDFASANGYTVDTTNTNKANGTLDMKKSNNELSIVVSARDAGSLVQLTYLERQ